MISLGQQKIIQETTEKFNPKLLGVFGSYARNDHNKDSDIDILVEFNSRLNLLEIIGLEQELSEKLGIKVDLVTTNSVNKQVKSFIERDLISLL
jgi:uncharacterized protein